MLSFNPPENKKLTCCTIILKPFSFRMFPTNRNISLHNQKTVAWIRISIWMHRCHLVHNLVQILPTVPIENSGEHRTSSESGAALSCPVSSAGTVSSVFLSPPRPQHCWRVQASNFGLSDVSLWSHPSYKSLAGISQKQCCALPGASYEMMHNLLIMFTLITWLGVSRRLLHCKVMLFLFITDIKRHSTLSNFHQTPKLFIMCISILSWNILLKGPHNPLPPVFIPMLKFFAIWPVGARSGWLLCPMDMSPVILWAPCFLAHVPGSSCTVSCSYEIHHLPKQSILTFFSLNVDFCTYNYWKPCVAVMKTCLSDLWLQEA